ncbi:HK97 gp10 family phage protein [Bacillus sp. SCS-151]|uniref:HK97 gp10 family phage protein n=1 Tax=Nanhaiella sioensis TaxID=3115293 RepID=UPI00397C8634
MARRNQIEGMRDLEKAIKKLGLLPQKCVTKSAKKGATIALKAARKGAPYDTGDLKKGIVLKGEKLKVKGKKVYQVTLDANMNDVFVKTSKDGKRSYYPASQEYGFMTKNGGYIPGYRFMRHAIENNVNAMERSMISVLSKEIDKLK